jgi:hypothetical protein
MRRPPEGRYRRILEDIDQSTEMQGAGSADLLCYERFDRNYAVAVLPNDCQKKEFAYSCNEMCHLP